MSQDIDNLIEFYNKEKDTKPSKSYIESLKKLLEFYGVKIE